MYQINDKEVVTFRTSQFERQEINTFLQSFQEQKDVQFSSIRDAFLTIFKTYKEDMKTLLAIQEENEQLRNKPIPQPDYSEYISEIESLKTEIETLKQGNTEAPQHDLEGANVLPALLNDKFAQIKTDIFENEDVTPEQMLDEMLQVAEIQKGNSEVKTELIAKIGYDHLPTDDELFADLIEIIDTPDIPQEPIVKEVEKQLAPNEVLVSMEMNQKKILQDIAEYRYQHRKDVQKLDEATIIRRIVFNEASLTDFGGCFETGISSEYVAKKLLKRVLK